LNKIFKGHEESRYLLTDGFRKIGRADNRDILIVIIIVFAPAFMRAIFQRCFVTRTLHIVQPDRPGSFAVCVIDHVSQMSVQRIT